MTNLLELPRRPDITFSRRGLITISAGVAKTLGIQPGDAINVAVDNGDFLLFVAAGADCRGRRPATCYPVNKGCRHFRANSVALCRAMFDACGISAKKISFFTGECVVNPPRKFIQIITRNPLVTI